MKTPTVGSGKICSAIKQLSKHSYDQYPYKDDDCTQYTNSAQPFLQEEPTRQRAEDDTHFSHRASITYWCNGKCKHCHEICQHSQYSCQWQTYWLIDQNFPDLGPFVFMEYEGRNGERHQCKHRHYIRHGKS